MPVIPLKAISYDDGRDLQRLIDVLNYNFRMIDWLLNHGSLDSINLKILAPSTAPPSLKKKNTLSSNSEASSEYRIQAITAQTMQVDFTQYYAVDPAVFVCVNGTQTNVSFSFIRQATPKGEFITGMNITFPDTSYVGKSASILVLGEGVAKKGEE